MHIRKNGFTILELLVVIAVIGLLAAVIMASVGTSRMKARDTRRKSDLYQIRLALQLYYDSYGRYPSPRPQTNCGGSDVWASSKGMCRDQWLTTDPNFAQFMKSVPVDPKNVGANAGWGDGNYVYSYYTTQNNADYNLIAQLENTKDKDRCETRIGYYHSWNTGGGDIPWCPPWPNNLGRSQNIYTEH